MAECVDRQGVRELIRLLTWLLDNRNSNRATGKGVAGVEAKGLLKMSYTELWQSVWTDGSLVELTSPE